jgi:glycosyltransferase involved in cell wall biosynthesis
MRICFVGLEIVPTNGVFVGGLVNNVIRLAKGLSGKGNKITIITSDVRKSVDSASQSLFRLKVVPTHGRYASGLHGLEFLMRGSLQLFKGIRENQFDVVHIHSAYPIFGAFSDILLLESVPFVFTLYSPLLTAPLGDRTGLYQRLSSPALSSLYFHGVDAIIAISNNVKDSLKLAKLDVKHTYMVPPAVDDTFFRKASSTRTKERTGLKEEEPMILYCGNWSSWKGVDILIESMEAIIERFPKAKLVTAWNEIYDWHDSRKRAIDRRIKELGLERSIVEMGVVPNVWELMSASDLLVVPFLNTDGVSDYPLVMAEAMACGKPVIATKVGGIPEIVHDGVNGLLVSPNNKEELEEALCLLLGDRKLKEEIGLNATRYAYENFSVSSVTEKHERIYYDLARK